jgi:ABC-type bacteriocin/lantibiotic exporters, contain an N-terminal double-glycine peptidase domain
MKFPHYTQHDAMDCGPTCLRMVAAHYGRVFSLEGLREKSLITREGVSMLGLSEAAEHIGFRTTGVKTSFDDLKEAPLPCIVHWNQRHFVVVYDIKTKKGIDTIWIADPAGGQLQYTKEEFCRCWISTKDEGVDVGVALLLEPSPDFYELEDEKVNRKGFSFLFSYLRPYKTLVIQLFLGLLFGSMLQLMLPFLTQSIVDFGISAQNIGFIYLVLIAQLVLTVSSSAVEFIRGWILLHLGTRINIALVSDFLIKLMRLPMGYFDAKMVGDILQRINDHTRIQNYLTNSSLSILFSVFNIVIFSAVLLLYSFTIFAIFFVGSFLYFMWVWLFMKRRAELDHKSFAQNSANQSNVIQLVTGMQEIKLNACEQQKRWEWERIQAKLFRLQIKGLALGQYQDSGALLINQSKNIIITALVAKLVIDGQMTLGMMMAVQYIVGQLNSPVDQLISFFRQTQDAQLSLERLSEVHDRMMKRLKKKPASVKYQ